MKPLASQCFILFFKGSERFRKELLAGIISCPNIIVHHVYPISTWWLSPYTGQLQTPQVEVSTRFSTGRSNLDACL